MLMTKLAQERLCIAIKSIAACEAILSWTVDYTPERTLFGQSVADFQNTQFVLAQLAAEISAGRILVDLGIKHYLDGRLSSLATSVERPSGTECAFTCRSLSSPIP